ncbi:GntR family transcriptional regulator [Bacillus piscicola]|uniref:GntR family transcriptional regulator n=1 Tax=Bacillus piscicola TaxID=1632684 RepID=UPI001F08A94E|nr:GntR family transcriptional regulator [Bacillus piscicola]
MHLPIHNEENSRAIKQKPLGQVVADELRRRIWTGEIAYGERLLEAELAAELDISRSSLREALQSLEYEGLVINKARKGTFVYNFTKQDMKEITELRYLIEIPALLKTTSRITDEDIAYLETLLVEMERLIDEEKWYDLFNIDMQFHLTLVHRCGNSRIISMYKVIQTQIRTFLSQLEPYYREKKQLFTKEHAMLVEAFKKRDVQKVERLAKEHINQVAVTLDFVD